MDKILLTTGGTGGHIFPALAVAEELRQRYPQAQLLFVGSLYGPEARLVAEAGIAFEGLPVRGFLGRGVKAVGAAARMAVALCKAVALIRRFQPQVVAGFGGYAAFAPMLAGRLCGVPGILHEQNAIAGTSNTLLARFARKVCISLPDTTGFPAEKCVYTGNPVRKVISSVGLQPRQFATKHLLILGGSQGAHALNVFLPEILPALREAGVEIIHQCGKKDEEATRAAYVQAGYSGHCVKAFVSDMASLYAWADVALCRSGASTVAELCAAGVPSLLVPFPYAVHDHQTRNAAVLEKAGAACLLKEDALRQSGLDSVLPALLADAGRRQRMSEAALAAARPDAASRVADVMASLLKA